MAKHWDSFLSHCINLSMDSTKSDNHLCPHISFHCFLLQFALMHLFVIFIFFIATTLMWHPVTPHFICCIFSCHIFIPALCLSFHTSAFSSCKVTEDSHYFSWEEMMSLIRYTHIPFYFHFSIISSTSLIHHYAPQHQCDHTWSDTHLLHQTNLTYLMDTCFTIHMFYFHC